MTTSHFSTVQEIHAFISLGQPGAIFKKNVIIASVSSQNYVTLKGKQTSRNSSWIIDQRKKSSETREW